jgi:hypothetical protein
MSRKEITVCCEAGYQLLGNIANEAHNALSESAFTDQEAHFITEKLLRLSPPPHLPFFLQKLSSFTSSCPFLSLEKTSSFRYPW